MKFQFAILAAVAIMAACNNAEPAQEPVSQEPEVIRSFYGTPITPDSAITVADLEKLLVGKDTVAAKVTATIEETCAKMGCWMDVTVNDSTKMTVFMKDHEFFVPKEGCAGKVAIFEGIAYYDTLSVEFLRHLAEDAQKSAEEIALITEPKVTIAFDADGVIIEGIPQLAADTAGDSLGGHDHSHEGHDHAEEATADQD
jgi:hypothetical protein